MDFMKSKEGREKIFTLIHKLDYAELLNLFSQDDDFYVHDLEDEKGYSALHLAAFKNSENIVKSQMDKEKANSDAFKTWLNKKTTQEGFTALHFASFKGNLTIIRVLVEYGSNIHAVNNYGINMLHVAAQGDQAASIVYFIEKGLDYNRKDNRGSTPLHWACYAGSEIATMYLLSWKVAINEPDSEGLSPLHLSVKMAGETKSTRTVRNLLLKGARRDLKDNEGRKPIDLVEENASLFTANELLSMLEEPRYYSCLMLKNPLIKMYRNPFTLICFILIFTACHLLTFYLILYCERNKEMRKILFGCSAGLFVLTLIFLVNSWLKDPGYIKKSKYSILVNR